MHMHLHKSTNYTPSHPPPPTVRHVHTGNVYFQGTLAHPITPSASLWTFEGARTGAPPLRGSTRPEGLLLYLSKQQAVVQNGYVLLCVVLLCTVVRTTVCTTTLRMC